MDGVQVEAARPVDDASEHAVFVAGDAHGNRAEAYGGSYDTLPEFEMINWSVLLEIFFQSASSSARKVGFIWATVVLLGGFVSKLNAAEFWLVTVLSFFQAMRIFSGDWDSDQMVLYGLLLPPRTSSTADHTPAAYRIFTKVVTFMEQPITPCCIPKWGHLFICGKLLLLVAAVAIRLLRVMAIAGPVALFATHVVLQRLARRHSAGADDDDEDTNMRAALNLFYGLAVGQALLSYMAIVCTSSRSKLVDEVRRRLGLQGLDDELLELYYTHVRRTVRKLGPNEGLQATIIRFALESLNSATHGVRQSGVKALHVLMECTAATPPSPSYGEDAALKTRESPEAIKSLFWMAALVSPDERTKRYRAACILAKLASTGTGLRVSGIPSAMSSVCSLLEVDEEEVVLPDNVDPVWAVCTPKNLLLKGLQILEHLSCSADNLTEICKSDQLMSIITKFTTRDLLFTTEADKARTSLLVLSRLAGAADNQGVILLRQLTRRNARLMSNVRAALQDPGVDVHVRVLAVQTVAGLASDGEFRDCAAARKMIAPLLGAFCGGSPHGPGSSELTRTAGKALAMLTTESRANCSAILEADDDLRALCGMLFGESRAACRGTVACIMANLCACSEPGSHGALKAFIRDNISEVLRRTCEVQNHATEDLEAFLGLGLQFARWTCARDFAKALDSIGRENYTRKLISTVQENQSPGVLRPAIEQAIWMMHHEVEQFRGNGMEAALRQAQVTIADILDDHELPSPNGPVSEHEEPLPSVVKRALKLIRNCQSASR